MWLNVGVECGECGSARNVNVVECGECGSTLKHRNVNVVNVN